MNTVSNFPKRRSPAPQVRSSLTESADSLAYEDVVALATRLSKKGYSQLGADFLAFANSATGFSSLRSSPVAAQTAAAASPYLAAATLLLRAKNLRRIDVGKAELLIELARADATLTEDEPPMFMD